MVPLPLGPGKGPLACRNVGTRFPEGQRRQGVGPACRSPPGGCKNCLQAGPAPATGFSAAALIFLAALSPARQMGRFPQPGRAPLRPRWTCSGSGRDARGACDGDGRPRRSRSGGTAWRPRGAGGWSGRADGSEWGAGHTPEPSMPSPPRAPRADRPGWLDRPHPARRAAASIPRTVAWWRTLGASRRGPRGTDT